MTDPTLPNGHDDGPSSDGLPPRYRLIELLASGGGGQVYRAHDGRLDREVALKVLFKTTPHGSNADQARRAEREVQVTTRLQHRGIVAVYDAGELDSGNRWYAMRKLRGRQFDQWVEQMRSTTRALRSQALRSVVEHVGAVSRIVAYAHQEGVVHCDLKPSNIMVERNGDVQVIDWGAARQIGDPRPVGSLDDLRIEGGRAVTVTHVIVGTPHYMAPECLAADEPVAASADVYALGVVLYELLAGRLPYDCPVDEVLRRLPYEPPPALSALVESADRDWNSLVEIVERAMRREPTKRPADCGVLADDLARWLRTYDERRAADAMVDRCRDLLDTLADQRAQRVSAQAAAADASVGVVPNDPVERKIPAWQFEDQARALSRAIRETQLSLEQRLHAALHRDRRHPRAHQLLASLYRTLAEDAAAAGQTDDAEAFALRVAHHDQGEHRDWCRGEGRLSVITRPAGAAVTVRRLEMRNRRLVLAAESFELGHTPVLERSIGRGSYVIELKPPQGQAVRYPVFIERAGHWRDRSAEGVHVPVDLRETSGVDACFVPAGWFRSGGDPEAPDSLPAARRWTDAFIVERFPVTNARYLEFLNDLAREDLEAARRHCPRQARGTAGQTPKMLYLEDDGRFSLPADERFGAEVPVTLVDWHSATAFARWQAARTGQPWRLLDAVEWEKAARGVDGRTFPWGYHPEPTFANMLRAHAGRPHRTIVDSFPIDESVYGVRGMAGNVRDWCADWYARSDDQGSTQRFRNVRGGSFTSAAHLCRLAVRFGSREDDRLGGLGFRLGRSAQ